MKIQFKKSSIKVTKKSVRLDIAKYSFSNRVVNEWNNLIKEVIASKTLAGFKKKLVITGDLYKLSASFASIVL